MTSLIGRLSLCLAALALLGQACSGPREDPLENALEKRGIAPGSIPSPRELTPEMTQWVRKAVPRGTARTERARRLLQALSEREMRYETGYTGDAAEVFATGRYNCLSFSHLYVGLARSVGVRAFYMRVERVEEYRKEGDLLLVSGHVTAGYGRTHQRQVLEFGALGDLNFDTARPISDLEALALHYSNRGAELLQGDADAKALATLETAVRPDPDRPGPWTNLGVARRRTGDAAGARRAYLQAVQTDSQAALAAYHNLLGLARREQGNAAVVRELLEAIDRRGNRNPFFYISLGDASIEIADLDAAGRFYERAYRLGREHAEAVAALGLWSARREDHERARELLAEAEALEPGHPRVVALRRAVAAGPQRTSGGRRPGKGPAVAPEPRAGYTSRVLKLGR